MAVIDINREIAIIRLLPKIVPYTIIRYLFDMQPAQSPPPAGPRVTHNRIDALASYLNCCSPHLGSSWKYSSILSEESLARLLFPDRGFLCFWLGIEHWIKLGYLDPVDLIDYTLIGGITNLISHLEKPSPADYSIEAAKKISILPERVTPLIVWYIKGLVERDWNRSGPDISLSEIRLLVGKFNIFRPTESLLSTLVDGFPEQGFRLLISPNKGLACIWNASLHDPVLGSLTLAQAPSFFRKLRDLHRLLHDQGPISINSLQTSYNPGKEKELGQFLEAVYQEHQKLAWW